MRAQLLKVQAGSSQAAFEQAGERLRAGKLVAFPTETVYGLGAHALQHDAVLSIFRAKGRPLTDPLIVHVPDAAAAAGLVEVSTAETSALFGRLAQAFWPGPLTLVARAAPHVPEQVTAGTGFVGVRVPSHPVAQELLRVAGVPIAAPSANRFGHVSPSRAEHVRADLSESDVLILDGGQCAVGVESTVLKLDEGKIHVLRPGGVGAAALQSFLEEEQRMAACGQVAGEEPGRGSTDAVAAAIIVPRRVEQGGKAMQAPGGLLTHYSPSGVDSFILRDSTTAAAALDGGDADKDTEGSQATPTVATMKPEELRRSAVIDFGARLERLRDDVALYLELSASGDVQEAQQRLFEMLRETEQHSAVKIVLLPDFGAVPNAEALADRCFRAASGRVASLELG